MNPDHLQDTTIFTIPYIFMQLFTWHLLCQLLIN
jgi:hypothetical protein